MALPFPSLPLTSSSYHHSRPATSFRWFTSPFKTLRYIIWRNYKWWILLLLITLLLIAAVLVFLYAMPVSKQTRPTCFVIVYTTRLRYTEHPYYLTFEYAWKAFLLRLPENYIRRKWCLVNATYACACASNESKTKPNPTESAFFMVSNKSREYSQMLLWVTEALG